MFPKLFQGFQQSQYIRGFSKSIHTQMCIASLFHQRKKVNDEWRKKVDEWNDDEDEQRRAFHEEEEGERKRKNSNLHPEKEKEQRQFECDITGKIKKIGSVDCTCKRNCIVKQSETYLIHYEGGCGSIPIK
jgi:hypothetical protein